MASNSSPSPIFQGPVSESFLKEYSLVEFLGSGSYGGVYKAVHKSPSNLKSSAVKITYLQKHLNKGQETDEATIKAKMQREFLLPFGKQHENIVNVYGAVEAKLDEKDVELLLKYLRNAENRDAKLAKANLENWAGESRLDALLIHMELCGITLREWIEKSTQMSGLHETQKNIIQDVVSGLEFLHENKILHRDLKSENIFFAEGHVKIGDFGIGRIVHSDDSRSSAHTVKPVTTPLYRAPELDTHEYTLQADLFSLGLLIVEVLKMLKGKDRRVDFSRVKSREFEVPLQPFVNAKKVVEKLTEEDVTKRMQKVADVYAAGLFHV